MASSFQVADMPLTIMTEVTSVYPGRGRDGTTEALIAAGTSALGSESHPALGWGTDNRTGYVQRADSESSVIECFRNQELDALQCGQKMRIYPYNVANASDRFGWYFVVDSSRIDRGDEIVDILVRWRD